MTCGSNKPAWWLCIICNYEWEAEVGWRNKGVGYPRCAGRVIKTGINDFATLYKHLLVEWDYERNKGLQPEKIAASSHLRVWWKCGLNHSWSAIVSNRTLGKTGCPECTKKHRTSQGERDLAKFIRSIVMYKHIRFNDRDHGANGVTELDICLPGVKKAVEFNGLYYHSPEKRGRTYHADKTINCRKAGIDLLHRWEDDWNSSRKLVEDAVRVFLEVEDNLSNLRSYTAKKFLQENYIRSMAR